MKRTRVVVLLVLLCLLDMVSPVPILGLILLHSVFTRPEWLRRRVEEVYR